MAVAFFLAHCLYDILFFLFLPGGGPGGGGEGGSGSEVVVSIVVEGLGAPKVVEGGTEVTTVVTGTSETGEIGGSVGAAFVVGT